MLQLQQIWIIIFLEKVDDMMNTRNLFYNLTEKEIKKIMRHAETKAIEYKKDQTIITNVRHTNLVGLILEGTAKVISFDYDGNKTLLEELEKEDVFGSIFSCLTENELEVVATTTCKIIFFDYQTLISQHKIAENMLYLLSNKLLILNERIEILSKKTIREKLLVYLSLLKRKYNSKYITIPFSYTELAEYLGVNRSAMSRELKNLKEEGFIETYGTKVKIKY